MLVEAGDKHIDGIGNNGQMFEDGSIVTDRKAGQWTGFEGDRQCEEKWWDIVHLCYTNLRGQMSRCML